MHFKMHVFGMNGMWAESGGKTAQTRGEHKKWKGQRRDSNTQLCGVDIFEETELKTAGIHLLPKKKKIDSVFIHSCSSGFAARLCACSHTKVVVIVTWEAHNESMQAYRKLANPMQPFEKSHDNHEGTCPRPQVTARCSPQGETTVATRRSLVDKLLNNNEHKTYI